MVLVDNPSEQPSALPPPLAPWPYSDDDDDSDDEDEDGETATRKKKEDERAAANEAAKAAGQKAAILSMNMYASTNSLSKAFKGATSGYVSPSTASPSMNRSASSLL